MKIFRTDKLLTITYGWWKHEDQGICGHLYECIEYFFYLDYYYKNQINILIPERSLNYDILKEVIQNKYLIDSSKLENILNCIIFQDKPDVVICNNVLFVDGDLNFLKFSNNKNIILKAKNVISFGCDKNGLNNKVSEIYELYKSNVKNFYNLIDHRIYKDLSTLNNVQYINYIKKIYFSLIIPPKKEKNRSLLYLTKSCRKISPERLKEIIKENKKYLIITDEEYNDFLNNDKILQINPPIKNIFEQFNEYIYTDIDRKWDCSSRFLGECKYFNKNITLELKNKENYLKEDLGLRYRLEDINSNLNKIELNLNDNLKDILNDIL